MFRNYLTTALRNIAHNKLYAAINIIGLTVGFTTALLIALFVRDELSYDTWIPSHDRSFLMTSDNLWPNRTPTLGDKTGPEYASWLALDYPAIQAISRLSDASVSLRRGDIEANEQIYWADPDFFSIVPLPIVAGDPTAALQDPTGLVMTRSMARKYFGRDNPIGETIEIDRQNTMRVMAVLEDLPSNTHLDIKIIASGRASFSGLTKIFEKRPYPRVYTYFKLRSGARIDDLRRAIPDFYLRHNPDAVHNAQGIKFAFPLLSLSEVHLAPGNTELMKPRGDRTAIYAVSGVGILLIAVAAINFINLMTARATRRAVEIGVRKVSGAFRTDLVIQFIGETTAYALISVTLALILVRFLLPPFNAFLQRTISGSLWRDPILVVALVCAVLSVGVLAGAYPAFVLAKFKPANVLKSKIPNSVDSAFMRQLLVVLQFGILTAMIAATGTIYRQTQYAFTNGLRLNADQVLVIPTDCKGPFKEQVKQLAGVHMAACSSPFAMTFTEFSTVAVRPDGTQLQFVRAPIDFGFFEVFGLHPLAGRLFSRDHPADAIAEDKTVPFSAPLIVNETAVRQLGFSSPEAAVGQIINYMGRGGQIDPSQIVGVVPDFAVDAVHRVIPPTVYFIDSSYSQFLSVKLAGAQIPETFGAIDQLWKSTGEARPITRFFLDDRVQALYLDMERQTEIFTIFAGVAVLLASLGLFGLSTFIAERSTKEIGIRKAMGASSRDVLRMRLWQFVRPVVLANLIAWPVAYFAMRHWLEGFSYHVNPSPLMFLSASGLAIIIALVAVTGHALLAARALPVTALRYE